MLEMARRHQATIRRHDAMRAWDEQVLHGHKLRERRLGAKALQTLWVAQHYRAASTFGSSSEDSRTIGTSPSTSVPLMASTSSGEGM